MGARHEMSETLSPDTAAASAGPATEAGPAESRLPGGVWALIAGVVVAGAAAVAALFVTPARESGVGPVVPVMFFTVLVLVSWLFPLIMHRGSESEAVHPDEAAFVVAAILLPPIGVLVVFAMAVAVSHIVRRRAWPKALFNCGQLVPAAGRGARVDQLVGGPAPVPSSLRVAAAIAGVVTFFAVNSLSMAVLMQAVGFKSLRAAFVDGAGIRVRLAGGSIVIGVFVALASAAQPWILACGFLPFLILRQVLTGHFQARHDPPRLQGLLRATIEAHSTMGAEAATRAIEEAATDLLRCQTASITDQRPAEGALAAALDQGGS